jgi:hypothetical protein
VARTRTKARAGFVCGELHGERHEQQVDLKLRRKWPNFLESKERRKKVRAAESVRQLPSGCGVLPVHNELARWLGAAQRAQITTRLSGREVKKWTLSVQICCGVTTAPRLMY